VGDGVGAGVGVEAGVVVAGVPVGCDVGAGVDEGAVEAAGVLAEGFAVVTLFGEPAGLAVAAGSGTAESAGLALGAGKCVRDGSADAGGEARSACFTVVSGVTGVSGTCLSVAVWRRDAAGASAWLAAYFPAGTHAAVQHANTHARLHVRIARAFFLRIVHLCCFHMLLDSGNKIKLLQPVFFGFYACLWSAEGATASFSPHFTVDFNALCDV
jgi:hypothetical protein